MKRAQPRNPARLLPVVAAVRRPGRPAAAPAHASSHREAPAITTTPKVDGTDFYMFNSYEPARLTGPGYVTLVANYLPLQDAYGGPNYFKLDPNALYEIHVDNNGDGKEDITFQFRFNNTLRGTTLKIGGTDVAIPLTQSGQISAPNAAASNVNETFTVDIVRGDRRTGARGSVTNATGGSNIFAKPVDNIGLKTIPNYAAYAAQHIYTVNIPGCTSPARSSSARGRTRSPSTSASSSTCSTFPARPTSRPPRPRSCSTTRRRTPAGRPRRCQRDDARGRGADQLPARDRRQRSGDRRLDDGEPAPGIAPQQRAEERPPDLGADRRRVDAGLAPRHAARQRGRHRPARQGQVQQLEAEGRRPVRDLRDQPDAAGAGRDRAGDAGHRADQLPAHGPGDDLPDRHQRRQPAEGVLGSSGDGRRFRDAAPQHGDRADAEATQNRLGLLGGLLGPRRRTSPAIRTAAAERRRRRHLADRGDGRPVRRQRQRRHLQARRACKPSAAPLGTAAFGLHDGVDQAGAKVKAAGPLLPTFPYLGTPLPGAK
jgi:hypothetical protein